MIREGNNVMKLFSERKGLKTKKSVIQINSVDDDLRNGLWNALKLNYWTKLKKGYISSYPSFNELLTKLWHDYFKKPLDTLMNYWPDTYKKIREYFFKCEWYEVYDFIEFIANNYPDDYTNSRFMDFCNSVLEREISAYRFVDGKIVQITSKNEIDEIEQALKDTDSLTAVNIHLKRALELIGDRQSPDYRNSIKESISAVESICKLIAKEKKATLNKALEKIENKVGLHPALKKAFNNLYGFTSDAEGIRHALMDEPNLGFAEAKFMLVSCSAFINYIISKVSKAEISIESKL